MALNYQLVNVGGVERVHRLQGEVVDLFRDPDKSTYPEDGIIPMQCASAAQQPGQVEGRVRPPPAGSG